MASSRRTFIKASGAGLVTAALAGCSGNGDGDGSSDGTMRIPGLYDMSGATASVGAPTANGSQDAVKYINDNDVLDVQIDHPNTDYSYEVPEARTAYESFTSPSPPPAMLGWGTADTNLLAPRVAEDEVVYVSASYSPQHHESETPYNFFGNIDYTTQIRVLVDLIEQENPDATIGLVMVPTLEHSGNNGAAYAEERGFDVEIAELPFAADSADSQVRRMRDAEVDYIIGHTIWDPFLVLAQSVNNIYPDVELMGTTWCVDERSVDEAPDVFDGVRFNNSFATFQQALDAGRGGDAIETAIQEYRGSDAMEDVDIANLNYVRGFIHALLLAGGIQNAMEEDLDVSQGSNIRQGMLGLDEWDNWGLSEPFNYQEDDRRGTMTGRIFEVQGEEIAQTETIELEFRDEWIGV